MNNIFGVDIDPQAVEVAKLSLLLKVIEGVDADGVRNRTAAAGPSRATSCAATPSLARTSTARSNSPAAHAGRSTETTTRSTRPTAFPSVTAAGGFDAVVGNPPWLMAGYYVVDCMDYFGKHYDSASGKTDLYYLFLEKATRLVRKDGRIGMIVPSKLFQTEAASALRGLLASESWVESLVDFGLAKVFAQATNYSAILQLRGNSKGPITVTKAGVGFSNSNEFKVSHRGPRYRALVPAAEAPQGVVGSAEAGERPVGGITQRFGTGAQTGADPIMLLKASDAKRLGIENTLLRPTYRGRHVRRYRLADPDFMVFPYVEVSGEFVLMDQATLKGFPTCWSYLNEHRKRLDARLWFGKSVMELAGAWYGLPYLDKPSSFSSGHLLTPSLAGSSQFAIGDGSLFVTGTAGVTSVIPAASGNESLSYLSAVLNSALISEFITDHSTPYQGGYFKFSAPYLRDVPVRRIDFGDPVDVGMHDDLAALGTKAADLATTAENGSGNDAITARKTLAMVEGEINRLVTELYGVTAKEAAVLST